MDKTKNAQISGLLKQGQTLFFASPPDLDGAIKAFQSVTEQAPDWMEGFHWLGSALEQRGKLENAIAMFQKAVQLDKHDSRPLISLGVCFVKAGRLNEAIKYFRSGLELKPHYGEADARLMLADALERNGKIQDAIVEWKKISEMTGFYPSGDAPMIEAKAKLMERGIKIY
ncbi:MAG TPA: tetratricopeptide repeat protein [Verrucomicrobiae bacterium]|nr:tetratricopeptide repeat protein [Verrucomicrobiae bacterium]